MWQDISSPHLVLWWIMRILFSLHLARTESFKIKVVNSNTMREQQWVKIKLYLPEGVTAVGASTAELPLNNLYLSCAEKEFEINTEGFSDSRLELIVDVSLTGRTFKRTCEGCVICGKIRRI